MEFAQQLLFDDEELLAELRPHPVLVVPPVALTLLAAAGALEIALQFPRAPSQVAWVLLAMVCIPAIWAIARILRWRSVRFIVTTSRLLYRRGVLSRDVVQLRFQRVAEVHCSQTLLGRVIGYGQLVFDVVGEAGPLVVEEVRRPRALQRLVTAQLDRLDRRDPRDPPGPRDPRGRLDALDAPGAPSEGRRLPDPTAVWSAPGAAPAAVGASRVNQQRPYLTPPHGSAAVADPGEPVGRPAEGAPYPTMSLSSQLLELDELRRRGILTNAEFAAKKAQLLDRL